MAVRRHVIVKGNVQGVFFRDSTEQEASSKGVSGWVRNRDDGTVEAVFEGDEGDVASMVVSVGLGPPEARVETVEAHDEQPEGLQGFVVS
jgi:acylphosphatase